MNNKRQQNITEINQRIDQARCKLLSFYKRIYEPKPTLGNESLASLYMKDELPLQYLENFLLNKMECESLEDEIQSLFYALEMQVTGQGGE